MYERAVALRRDHPEVLFAIWGPEDLVENLLPVGRQRRELLRHRRRVLARALDPAKALLVPYLLQGPSEVHQAEEEASVRRFGVVRREPSIYESSLGVDLSMVAFPARHFLGFAVRGRERKPILSGSGMREVDESNLNLAALATPRATSLHRSNEQVFAMGASEGRPRGRFR